jgi:hypothetical protein
MLRWIAFITVLLTTADHWTTYLCLREPISGFDVIEANPVAVMLFKYVGLGPRQLVDTAITRTALCFQLFTTQLSPMVKYGFLTFVCFATSFAVVNNLRAMDAIGLSPLGWS